MEVLNHNAALASGGLFYDGNEVPIIRDFGPAQDHFYYIDHSKNQRRKKRDDVVANKKKRRRRRDSRVVVPRSDLDFREVNDEAEATSRLLMDDKIEAIPKENQAVFR